MDKLITDPEKQACTEELGMFGIFSFLYREAAMLWSPVGLS